MIAFFSGATLPSRFPRSLGETGRDREQADGVSEEVLVRKAHELLSK